jgi:hypothetical protein
MKAMPIEEILHADPDEACEQLLKVKVWVLQAAIITALAWGPVQEAGMHLEYHYT